MERSVWELALPFQDKRGDKGHAEVVAYFAIRLLEHIPADRNIVVPATILHDTGWSAVDNIDRYQEWPNEQKNDRGLRTLHQAYSIAIAEDVLKKSDYSDPEKRAHIYQIISQHDTREGFFSKEDGVMRDADKLWRFTPVAMVRSYGSEEAILADAENRHGEGFFCYDLSRKISEIELQNTLAWWRRVGNFR